MQQKLEDITKRGATLLAISPMLKEVSRALVKKHQLTFPVLSDPGNAVAEKYGLVFTVADTVQPLYSEFGINIPAANGDESHQLPFPAVYIIDTKGIIQFSFIDVDHTKRLDPDIMMKELENIT